MNWLKILLASTLIMADILLAAELTLYGHKNFVPSDERPIYWKAGNNGYYPGATPPLEFWDGTPVERKEAGKSIWDFSDDKPKNIRWKVQLPGWSMSHPIVVKGRVYSVGEPDFVSCHDLATGKLIWQRRMMPYLLDGLDEVKATQGQVALDLARALFYVSSGGGCYAGNNIYGLFNAYLDPKSKEDKLEGNALFQQKRDVATKLVRMIEKHRPTVLAFGDTKMVEALDKDLAILKAIITAPNLEAMMPLLKTDKNRSMNLVNYFRKEAGIDIGGSWWGYVGSADSTLASDGERIYGVFEQGQLFCLDLDGKLLWCHREKGSADNRGNFHRPPLLCGNLVLYRGKLKEVLRAYDKRTGKLMWETPFGHGYTVPCIVQLRDGASKVVNVIVDISQAEGKTKKSGITTGARIIRVADGTVVGTMPPIDMGRGAVFTVHGDIVAFGSTTDTGGGPDAAVRLQLGHDGKVYTELLWSVEDKTKKSMNSGSFDPAIGFLRLTKGDSDNNCALRDMRTGEIIGKIPLQYNNHQGAVIAGNYLIAYARNPGQEGKDATSGRTRPDRRAMGRLVIYDISDPTKPKLVSDKNLLGFVEPASDIILRDYMNEFDPYEMMGVYKGTPSYFSMMSGPVPHGDNLLIQTARFLYCIGNKP